MTDFRDEKDARNDELEADGRRGTVGPDDAQIQRLMEANVVDDNGDKIGGVGQVFLDDQTGRPSWVTVHTGLFGTKQSFVPLHQVSDTSGDELRVPYSKDVVKGAPAVEADHHITPEEEQELYSYYEGHGWKQDDWKHDDRRAAAGTAGVAGVAGTAGRDRTDADRTDADRTDVERGTPGDTADSVVAHEERLNVGTEKVEAGRVRLRKHVVTEQKTITVPVTREEVQVVREPVSGSEGTRGEIGDDDGAEVVLHEERPVVEKEVVATERVGLQKNTVREDQQVTENVAREEVRAEGDGVRDAGREGVAGTDPRDRDGDGDVDLKDKLGNAKDDLGGRN